MCLSILLILSGITVIAPSLLVFSGGLLCFLYLIFGFLLLNNKSILKIFKKDTYTDLSTGYIIMGILIGICIPSILISIIFKFLLWDNAKMMVLTGLLSLIILIIIIAIIQFVAKKIFFHLNLRFFIWSVLIAIAYLVPNSTLIDTYYLEDYPNYANAMKRYEEDPNNQANFNSLMDERAKYIEAKQKEFR